MGQKMPNYAIPATFIQLGEDSSQKSVQKDLSTAVKKNTSSVKSQYG